MRTRSKILLTLLSTVALVGLTTACTSSGAKSTGSDVIVDEVIEAPPPQIEEIPPAPSEGQVWIPGYWERDPGEWSWVKGRWETPPHASARWQPGHWQWREGQWHWTRGYWTAGLIDRVIADEPLPAPARKAEVITEEPSPEYVWVPGDWEREQDDWTWVEGHWEKPPHKNAHWQRGHWQWDKDYWRWLRGHWVTGSVGWIVDDIIEIPELLTETKPPKPGGENHWVAGYWEWNGKWTWIPGYWTSLPDPAAEWVAGHWEAYGTGGGWRWIAGHWQVS
jgi:hypothetical protein